MYFIISFGLSKTQQHTTWADASIHLLLLNSFMLQPFLHSIEARSPSKGPPPPFQESSKSSEKWLKALFLFFLLLRLRRFLSIENRRFFREIFLPSIRALQSRPPPSTFYPNVGTRRKTSNASNNVKIRRTTAKKAQIRRKTPQKRLMTLKTTRRRTKNATFLAVVVFFKAMIFQNSSKRDQIGLLAIFVRKLEKTKIKKKRPRMAHFWKTRYKVDNLKSLYLKSSTWRSKVAAVSTFSCRRFRRFSRRHPPKRVCVGVGKMRPEESDVKENPSQSVSQSVSQSKRQFCTTV